MIAQPRLRLLISFTTYSKQRKDYVTLTTNKHILETIDISPSLVANSDAKKILQPTRSKTIVRPKMKTPEKASKKQRLDDKQVAEDSQAEEISTRAWETLRF